MLTADSEVKWETESGADSEEDSETESDADSTLFGVDGDVTSTTTPDENPSSLTTPLFKGQQTSSGLYDAPEIADSDISSNFDRPLPIILRPAKQTQDLAVPFAERISTTEPVLSRESTSTSGGDDTVDAAQNVSSAVVSSSDGSSAPPSTKSGNEGHDQFPPSSATKPAPFVFGLENPGKIDFSFRDANRIPLSDAAGIKPSNQPPKNETLIKSEPSTDIANGFHWPPVGAAAQPVLRASEVFRSLQSPEILSRPASAAADLVEILSNVVHTEPEAIDNPRETKQPATEDEVVTHSKPFPRAVVKTLTFEDASKQQPKTELHEPAPAKSGDKKRKDWWAIAIRALRNRAAASKENNSLPTKLRRSLSFPGLLSTRRVTVIKTLPSEPVFRQPMAAVRRLDPLYRFETVLEKMNKTISKKQRSPGYVYVFERTDDSAPGLLKIGFSKELDKRLSKWAKCGPIHEVLHVWIPCAAAHHIEVLIQFTLGAYQRVEDNCRNCTGSAKSHIEWFEVSEMEVRIAVELWQAFAEMMPWIDEKGVLSERWQEAVKKELQNIKTMNKARGRLKKQGFEEFEKVEEFNEQDIVCKWLRDTMATIRNQEKLSRKK
ncbi:hypothetical protein QBC47DRAFT_415757 [Echria macrotheca]|uniref:Bacteriophage T5 Orf172 DNA-binding domain-containing protein n=1 Tax=Echria macrotheca TaxID=438768 RepID=A0AAJ0B9Q0_9PEZI|nr:hypothetical protein QBC47DRAFT_415757 [Echria macrotheca]